ncbi:MAG: F0F1 ATP synthase subunit A, partial [Alphaproteobacteria bacterium]|nr:F0F1 ATP synthase subunit A [Alphaproteobacteria bacterium]
MHSPMEQFEIKRWFDLHLGGLDVSFTNSATWMIIAVILATAIFVVGMRQRALVIGLILGFIGGVNNAWRAIREYSAAAARG